MSAHTPGPWQYLPGDEDEETCGLIVGKTAWVCDFVSDPIEANARLIAAAPDLLEALKEMVEIAELTIGWFSTPPNANGPLIQARAAIAKAEGAA